MPSSSRSDSLVGLPEPLPDFTEHTLSTERLLNGRLIEVQRDRVSLPGGGESWREYVLHPGAAIVAAFVDSDSLIFEYQYRYPPRRHFIELPAGKIDPGEAPEHTAARELLEETGYVAKRWQHVLTQDASIGYANEKIHLFVATGLHYQGHQRDAGEAMAVFTLKLDEAVAMVGRGEITDTKSAFALLWLDRFGRKLIA